MSVKEKLSALRCNWFEHVSAVNMFLSFYTEQWSPSFLPDPFFVIFESSTAVFMAVCKISAYL